MRTRRVGSFVETSAPCHSHPTQAKALKASRFSALVWFYPFMNNGPSHDFALGVFDCRTPFPFSLLTPHYSFSLGLFLKSLPWMLLNPPDNVILNHDFFCPSKSFNAQLLTEERKNQTIYNYKHVI